MSLFDALPGDPAYSNETPSDLRQRPLAERMRPRTLDEFVGQEHLLGPGKALRLQLETDDTTSMILWGPPGVGKTTLAKIIAHTTKATFIEFSAVVSGIKEIKQVMAEADQAASAGMRTILFVDEIHRFNRSQQDAFLPYVERGAIRLIGATTENPSFELNAALLSRCRVYVLEALSDEQIVTLLHRALTDKERGLGGFGITSPEDALQVIAGYSNGDVRRAYNVLEAAVRLAANAGQASLDGQLIADAVQQKTLLYDKSGEEHYNLISALHKSIRNSDPDAALYWLARMLRSGEDPDVPGAAAGSNGVRRHWSGGSGGVEPDAIRARFDGFSRQPGGRSGTGASRGLSGARAQVECAVHGVRRGHPRCGTNARRACSAALAQRAHAADGITRLWQRLSLCAR